MNFSEIQINAASESAAMGIQKHIPKIDSFAKSFSGRTGTPYNGVALPIFSNVSGVNKYENLLTTGNSSLYSDKYCPGEALQGTVINLDKLYTKSYALTDYEVGSSDKLYLADGARAMAEQISLEIANTIFTTTLSTTDILSANNYSLSADSKTKKAAFAGLFGAAAAAGANPYDCVVAVDAPTFSTLLETLGDSCIYGGPEAVRNGVVPGLYGFRNVVVAPALPSGVKGFIIPWESIGIVNRYNKPAVDGYEATFASTDPHTGFTIGYRVYEDRCKGLAIMAADCLWGVKLIQPSKIVRIVA